jgi:hypothetical protein
MFALYPRGNPMWLIEKAKARWTKEREIRKGRIYLGNWGRK